DLRVGQDRERFVVATPQRRPSSFLYRAHLSDLARHWPPPLGETLRLVSSPVKSQAGRGKVGVTAIPAKRMEQRPSVKYTPHYIGVEVSHGSDGECAPPRAPRTRPRTARARPARRDHPANSEPYRVRARHALRRPGPSPGARARLPCGGSLLARRERSGH